MERSKTQNNQWNATPIDKMRFIKSSSVPNGKNGIVIIDKWQTTLGQTIYTKTFHPQNISIQSHQLKNLCQHLNKLYLKNRKNPF